MEIDKNPMPNFRLVDPLAVLRAAGQWISDHLTVPSHTEECLSTHRRYHGAEEMLASELENEPWSFEQQLGHAVMRGEIDAEEAYRALADYEAWVEAGEPKLTTLTGGFVFK